MSLVCNIGFRWRKYCSEHNLWNGGLACLQAKYIVNVNQAIFIACINARFQSGGLCDLVEKRLNCCQMCEMWHWSSERMTDWRLASLRSEHYWQSSETWRDSLIEDWHRLDQNTIDRAVKHGVIHWLKTGIALIRTLLTEQWNMAWFTDWRLASLWSEHYWQSSETWRDSLIEDWHRLDQNTIDRAVKHGVIHCADVSMQKRDTLNIWFKQLECFNWHQTLRIQQCYLKCDISVKTR